MYKPSKKFIKDNNLQYYYLKKLEEIRSTDHLKNNQFYIVQLLKYL